MAIIRAKDLAKRLGLSAAAVSMALNGKSGISEETRERVMTEAHKAGYFVPKARQAKQAREQRGLVSFVIYSGIGVADQSTFQSEILKGVEAEAKRTGFRLMMHYLYADQPLEEQLVSINEDVSGIIMLGTDINEAQRNELFRHKTLFSVPMVVIDNFLCSSYADCIGNDNTFGAKSAVTYLINHGHRSIGYIRSKQRITNFIDRELGVRLSLDEHSNLGMEPLQVIDVDIVPDKAYVDILSWLNAGNRPVSAYFCENDMLAASLIRALKEGGYRVPDDVSVIGFDDVPICEMVEPPITTMHAYTDYIGSQAVRILEQRISDGDTVSTAMQSWLMKVSISLQVKERSSVKSV
jgi:DNA-binding LacI/PurR family transcriptional regulator